MPLFDHFGILAPFYDRFFGDSDHVGLIDLVDLPAGGVLLDAGGGTGRVSQVFARQAGHAGQTVVVDESLRMLKEARGKPELQTNQAHTEALPYADASFDGVIMVDALHHVFDQIRTVRELWRVLKPGGRLVIEEPDIQFPLVKAIALVEKLVLMRSRFLSPASIASLLPKDTAEVYRDGITAWVVGIKRPLS